MFSMGEQQEPLCNDDDEIILLLIIGPDKEIL